MALFVYPLLANFKQFSEKLGASQIFLNTIAPIFDEGDICIGNGGCCSLGSIRHLRYTTFCPFSKAIFPRISKSSMIFLFAAKSARSRPVLIVAQNSSINVSWSSVIVTCLICANSSVCSDSKLTSICRGASGCKYLGISFSSFREDLG